MNNIETTRQDSANAKAKGKIGMDMMEARFKQLSQKAAKTYKVDGFRKGKVPPHIIQARFGTQLMQDAEQELVKEFVDTSIKELKIDSAELLGSPMFVGYDKNDEAITLEVRFAIRPKIELDGLDKAIPTFESPVVSDDEIEQRIQSYANGYGEIKEVTIDRELKTADIAVIDFEGFVDNVAFEGGKAEKYSLEIGSGSFIPGFEDQLIGMKKGEERDIHVTFPAEYGAPNLAGKPARFAIKLHEIKEREAAAIDDSLAKKIMPNEEKATLELLKERIKGQIISEKKVKLYNEELKEKCIDGLLDTFTFDLPENIVEQEMDMLFRNEVRTLPQEELEALQNQTETIKEKRESHREQASKNVKLTLLIDVISREKKITVHDQELWQRIYFEAMNLRQDPKTLLDYYQKNGLIPALQMAILEDKVLTYLLDDYIKEQ